MIATKEHPAPAWSLRRIPLLARLSGRPEDSSHRSADQPPKSELESERRIRSILVPTDFSASSAEAVAQAVVLARRHDAALTILHVIDINPPEARNHAGSAYSLMRQVRAIGTFGLHRLAASVAQNQIKPQTLMVEGIPAEVIVENSSRFDLLVIGKKDSKSPWNPFSRHTARRVIDAAQCPVLVVDKETDLVGRKLEPKVNAAV
jgi:nucleotide-binding universal stress UspA family protein